MNTDRIVVVWFRTFALAVLGLILWLLCNSCAAAPVTQCPPNLAFVDRPEIWRSGQPTTVEQWQLVSSLGVSNVVKLNVGRDNTPGMFHVSQFNIPWYQQMFGVPTWKLDAAVNAITPGSLTHCQHGNDRTGLVIALYRVRHDHWTKADAEKEMLSHGFHKSLWGLWKAWKKEP